jgi:CHASE2 domain-containing sensor protein
MEFIRSVVNDPMFWTIIVCISVLVALRTWKSEHSNHFRVALILSIVVNAVMLVYTYSLSV